MVRDASAGLPAPPPVAQVIKRGDLLRRRRQTAIGACAFGCVGLIGVGLASVFDTPDHVQTIMTTGQSGSSVPAGASDTTSLGVVPPGTAQPSTTSSAPTTSRAHPVGTPCSSDRFMTTVPDGWFANRRAQTVPACVAFTTYVADPSLVAGAFFDWPPDLGDLAGFSIFIKYEAVSASSLASDLIFGATSTRTSIDGGAPSMSPSVEGVVLSKTLTSDGTSAIRIELTSTRPVDGSTVGSVRTMVLVPTPDGGVLWLRADPTANRRDAGVPEALEAIVKEMSLRS